MAWRNILDCKKQIYKEVLKALPLMSNTQSMLMAQSQDVNLWFRTMILNPWYPLELVNFLKNTDVWLPL